MALLAVLLLAAPDVVAAVSAVPGGVSVAAAGGLRVDAVTRTERGLALRLRSDADLSPARTQAVLLVRQADGSTVEIARARLEPQWLDRSPRRRARAASVEFALPESSHGALEVVLLAGR